METAVEQLVSELKKYDSAGLKDQSNYVIEMPTHILTELEEQAKEIEKQQIIDAYNNCIKDRYNNALVDMGFKEKSEKCYNTGKEYYKEKYEKN